MNKPFFTVVIPTYNRSKLLREAVESGLAQTFENFELIVVDDHSTDDTKSVVASFHDSRIRYVLNDRTKGGAGARNAGIFRANEDWVAFLDDDDVWLPNKLESVYNRIQQVNSNVGLVYSGSASYDFTNNEEVSVFIHEKEGQIQNDLLYKNYIGTFSGVVIRADLLRKVGGLDESLEALQDVDLYVRITGLCKVAFIKSVLTHLRISNKDRISLNFEKKLKSNLLFWEKYECLINQDCRLRHRAATRVFLFAFKQREYKYIVKTLPWTLAGLFVDTANFSWLCRMVYYHLRK